MADVEIYTQPWCGYCARAMDLLTRKGIIFREITAPRGTPEREEAIRRSGSGTVPQIFIGGACIGGCDDLLALERSGQLDTLVGG